MADTLDIFLSRVSARAADIDRADRARVRTNIMRPESTALPKAVVLVVVVAQCECGAIHRSSQSSVLVRYDDYAAGKVNSVHYKRTELTHFMVLPRERREVHIKTPYCEDCF
jgi:hypothetical protein